MVSPVHGDYRRCQAETPLIDLFKFAEPALSSERTLYKSRSWSIVKAGGHRHFCVDDVCLLG
jgi:hypothetical protein